MSLKLLFHPSHPTHPTLPLWIVLGSAFRRHLVHFVMKYLRQFKEVVDNLTALKILHRQLAGPCTSLKMIQFSLLWPRTRILISATSPISWGTSLSARPLRLNSPTLVYVDLGNSYLIKSFFASGELSLPGSINGRYEALRGIWKIQILIKTLRNKA